MKFGISTGCFYPIEPENAVIELSKINAQYIEIFFNCEYELSYSYLKSLRNLIDFYNMKVVSVHPYTSGYEPYLLFSSYKRRTDESIEKYCRYFEACNILGGKIVNLHGDKLGKKLLTDEQYCEVYSRLYEKGKKYDVIFSQENVNLFKASDPEFILKMRKILNDNVNFTLDIKQSVRAGFTPQELINAMGERICNVHISDNLNGKCVLPGDGKLDLKSIIGQIEKYNYKGKYLIEVYNDCYKNIKEIENSLNYCNNMSNKVE